MKEKRYASKIQIYNKLINLPVQLSVIESDDATIMSAQQLHKGQTTQCSYFGVKDGGWVDSMDQLAKVFLLLLAMLTLGFCSNLTVVTV